MCVRRNFWLSAVVVSNIACFRLLIFQHHRTGVSLLHHDQGIADMIGMKTYKFELSQGWELFLTYILASISKLFFVLPVPNKFLEPIYWGGILQHIEIFSSRRSQLPPLFPASFLALGLFP